MQVALSRNGVIYNIIEAQSVAAAQALFPDANAFEAVGLGIGWTYDGSEWTAPVVVPVDPVFPTLTRRQLLLALLSIDVSNDDVEAHINAITDPFEKASALIEWQDTKDYRRDHPLVVEIAEAMSLPPSQVDDLWRWAATI